MSKREASVFKIEEGSLAGVELVLVSVVDGSRVAHHACGCYGRMKVRGDTGGAGC